jgi:hypothetical protein
MSSLYDESQYPFLTRLRGLKGSYPALNQILNKIPNKMDQGRQIVESTYLEQLHRPPGRCAVLEFQNGTVRHELFHTAAKLRGYMLRVKAADSKTKAKKRLYILEDLQIDFVETVGSELGMDPLVIAEQMNTWNFADIKSVGHRALPSLTQPDKAFTIRYYEFRRLNDAERKRKQRLLPQPKTPERQGPRYKGLENEISVLGNQTTFAANRRYYEAWLAVEGPSMPMEESVAFVRRCASFWTSQSKAYGQPDGAWNGMALATPNILWREPLTSDLPKQYCLSILLSMR